MIASFRHKGLKRFFEADDRKRLPPDMVERIREIMTLLDSVTDIGQMNVPGFRLHSLKGDLRGFWSITVRANWRIVFRFEDGDAFDIDFVDYH
jgi:proteic killer suppression protein